jgi:hypothetical protein
VGFALSGVVFCLDFDPFFFSSLVLLSGVFFREEKRKYQTPNKRPHPKVQNTQWVANECVVHVDFVP